MTSYSLSLVTFVLGRTV